MKTVKRKNIDIKKNIKKESGIKTGLFFIMIFKFFVSNFGEFLPIS